MTAINRAQLRTLHQREKSRFLADHPKSAALYQCAQSSLHGGVPMNWIKKWAGAFPIFVKSAKGAHFTDVDDRDYIDLCLGDTGAMTGHSLDVVAEAVACRAKKSITLMLPSEDALWSAKISSAASDSRTGNSRSPPPTPIVSPFASLAKSPIGQKFSSFHYCYHGTVDESFATLEKRVVGSRRGNIGPPLNPAETTRVVEFNDLNGLEAALKQHDVACILAEPAMTNVGIILSDAGYWPAARELARRYASFLIADETHTSCAGPGGCTAAWKLDPDMLVFGKAIGSGIPGATFGVSEEVAQRISRSHSSRRLRRRRHAGRQRPLVSRRVRYARVQPDARRIRTHDSPHQTLQQRRRQ